jgi:hypothetical protein
MVHTSVPHSTRSSSKSTLPLIPRRAAVVMNLTVLTFGRSDSPRGSSACPSHITRGHFPKSLFLYKSSRHSSIDGAYFGTSFHSILFQVYPALNPEKSLTVLTFGRSDSPRGSSACPSHITRGHFPKSLFCSIHCYHSWSCQNGMLEP